MISNAETLNLAQADLPQALAHMSAHMREPQTVMSRNKRNPKACMGGNLVQIYAV
jgi:hypothetical protein